MEPFEIMISESQERMLCVVEPDRVDEVLAVCEKWLVNATAIGEVTDDAAAAGVRRRRARRRHAGARAGRRVPGLRPRAGRAERVDVPGPAAAAPAADAGGTLLALLGSANLASRRWAFEQYDCLVGSRTVRRPEQADAAVLRSQAAPRIAVSIDGNGRRVACDPYRGAVEAVLECCANLACAGAEPLGPDQLPELRQPGEAARRLAALARGGRLRPTPAARSASRSSAATSRSTTRPAPARSSRRRSSGWSASCPKAVALRPPRVRGGGRRRRRHRRRLVGAGADRLRARQAPRRGALGELPPADLGELRALHAAVRQAVRAGALRSAHDVAEGGLAVALAEACLAGGLGATVDLCRSDRRRGAPVRRGPGRLRRLRPRAVAARVRRRGDADRHGWRVRPRHRRLASVPVGDLAAAHAGGLASLLHSATSRRLEAAAFNRRGGRTNVGLDRAYRGSSWTLVPRQRTTRLRPIGGRVAWDRARCADAHSRRGRHPTQPSAQSRRAAKPTAAARGRARGSARRSASRGAPPPSPRRRRRRRRPTRRCA